MADYERTTRRSSLEALPPALREALDDQVAGALLTLGPEPQVFVTESRRTGRRGLLARMTGTADPDHVHATALVLGTRDVLVARHGEHFGSAVLAARLNAVDVGGLPSLGGRAPVADDGVTITGFPVSGPDGGRGSYHVGLGAPDGPAARHALTEAVRAAKAR